jgi:hypothetical protein
LLIIIESNFRSTGDRDVLRYLIVSRLKDALQPSSLEELFRTLSKYGALEEICAELHETFSQFITLHKNGMLLLVTGPIGMAMDILSEQRATRQRRGTPATKGKPMDGEDSKDGDNRDDGSGGGGGRRMGNDCKRNPDITKESRTQYTTSSPNRVLHLQDKPKWAYVISGRTLMYSGAGRRYIGTTKTNNAENKT